MRSARHQQKKGLVQTTAKAGQTERRALVPSPGIVASGRLTMCYAIRERGPKQPSLGELDPAMHGFISFDGNKNRGEF